MRFAEIEINRLNDAGTALSKDDRAYVSFLDGGKWVRPWMKDHLNLRSPGWERVNNRWEWTVPKTKGSLLVDEALKRGGTTVVNRVYSAKVKCTGSCKTAFGPDCECSCMGAHHGKGIDLDRATVTILDVPELENLYLHRDYLEVKAVYVEGSLISREVKDLDGNYIPVPDNFVGIPEY